MDIILWIAQGLLAFAFFGAGMVKIIKPEEELQAGQMKFIEDLPKGAIKVIGALEVAGAIGLILPMLTNILPILTPLAAVGLVLTMIGAVLTHLRRKEYPKIGPNIVLLAIALFIAVGRLAIVPVA